MLSCLASLWMAAAMGQAPDQSEWLKSVPTEAAVVVRVKALETVRDDLLKMLEAMSGNAVALARPQIEQGLEMMKAQGGPHSVEHPFFVLMTLPKDGGPMPGWAVMVQSDNYEAVVKSISKKDNFKSSPKDGLDTFDGPDGQPWFTAKGTGFVTFGPDQGLVKSTLKSSNSLEAKLTPEIRQEFLGGDMGVYVNIAAIQAQYGEQIDQAKQMFLGLMDQAGGQLDAKGIEAAKMMYGGMFDSIKVGDGFALGFDFAPAGLNLSGALTLKPGTDAAKMLATAKTGTGAGLAKLPADAFVYSYMNPSPEWMKSMSKLGMSMMSGGKGTPELEKAQQMLIDAGGLETYQAMTGGPGGLGGMAALAFTTPTDPAKAVEASLTMSQALKTPDGMFKDVVVTPKVETYKGFTLSSAKMPFNFEKMAPPNAPGGAEGMKKMMGGDTMTSWFGTDGKTLLTVSGKTIAEAKSKIDAFVSGEGSVGKVPAFEAIRGKLPKDVTLLMLVNAQGMVKFASQTVGAMSGNAPAIPGDMPKEPALFGGAMTITPKGYQFQFVLPSNVGAVIEKGLVPVVQQMNGVIQ